MKEYESIIILKPDLELEEKNKIVEKMETLEIMKMLKKNLKIKTMNFRFREE